MSEPMPVPPAVPSEFEDMARTQMSVQDQLLSIQSVVGVALGRKLVSGQETNDRAIVVLVEDKLAEAVLPATDVVPHAIGGIPTDVQAIGKLRAGPQPLATVEAIALVKRTRPVLGGVSVGHPAITAGTVATGCYDASAFPGSPGRFYLLSNNHVLADTNKAAVGDAILQPGRYDGGTAEADTIGRLSRFVPIQFLDGSATPPVNEVDAALAEVDLSDLDRRIHWVGNLRGVVATPAVDLLVSKCGRTTGFTTGRIVNINATVDVNYGDGRVARFVGQLITTPMSAPGDSGSLVADLHGHAVGLLFAGSTRATVVNPIEAVQRLLGVKVADG
ncbi:serine protease [Allorhizocola rhizosphaerae]|uniref:serine protease n=1 Tax=Allorhizocola rhizosphaerae TaxID=1872709 RepID=UPI000E3E600C|nr:serine protease [Allorhizocola rhizosphaerae]